jgi:hypothetical protein
MDRIEPSAFVERMTKLLGERMDLLLGLGTFVPPQFRHLIYSRVQAVAAAQQNNVSGVTTGSSGSPFEKLQT